MHSEYIVVDGYRDLTVVGSGGFSTVYRAHQEKFNRFVAIKVLSSAVLDERAQRRFLRECTIAGQLSAHPNIVSVFDSGFTRAGQPYIVMEYMAGGSVAKGVDGSTPDRVREVLRTGVKICGALATANNAGVLHRDVKPLNILRSEFGEPCLSDFGISAAQTGPSSVTMTASLTPLYSAPEVIDGADSTIESEVYSLGATLFALLEGRSPFEPADGEPLRKTLNRIFEEQPRFGPDVPEPLRAAIDKSLAKAPADRFHSAAELGRSLQEIEETLGFRVTDLVVTNVGSQPSTAGPPIPTVEAADPDSTEPRTVIRSGGGGRRLEEPPTLASSTSDRAAPSANDSDTEPAPLGDETVLRTSVRDAVADTVADGEVPATARAGHRGSRRTLSAGIAALALVGAIAVVAALFLEGGRSKTPAGWSGATPVFTAAELSPDGRVVSVSCASPKYCVAVTDKGWASVYQGSSWSNPAPVAAGAVLRSISCPLEDHCEALDRAPAQKIWAFDGHKWSLLNWMPPGDLTSVACSPSDFCVAGEGPGPVMEVSAISCPEGNHCIAVGALPNGDKGMAADLDISTYTNQQTVDDGLLLSVSCSSTTFCAAADDHGATLVMHGSSWTSPHALTSTPVDTWSVSTSCASSNFCVSTEEHSASIYNGSGWSAPVAVSRSARLSSVSCSGSRFCVLFDAAGNAYYHR